MANGDWISLNQVRIGYVLKGLMQYDGLVKVIGIIRHVITVEYSDGTIHNVLRCGKAQLVARRGELIGV
jgi:hypothetical protein